MPFTVASSSEDLPSHLQWTMSRDVFKKMVSGVSWLSRSTQARPSAHTEYQPLLANRNYSCNDFYRGRGRTSTPIFQNHMVNGRRFLWPTNEPVTISDVCRSATPLIPPIQEHEEGVSWVTASFLLLNAALGIGILNFPAAYDLAGGILSATCTQLLMLVLIVMTMLILAHCSDVNLDVTYHDVLLSMCGKFAQKLAALSITCTCYGVCVAIFIIIGDQLDRLFLAGFGSTFCHHWYLERHFTVPVASLLLVLPICYFRRVDFLRYAGSLGIFAMLYPVFLTIYGYFKLDVKDVVVRHQPESTAKLLTVVPVLCLAYQCQEVVVPVYSCMRARNLPSFFRSCCLAMGVLFALYSAIGCFGYLTFGRAVAPNVMLMYDARDPVVAVGIAALVLKMVVTYPVLALCGRGAVDGLYSEIFRLSAADFVRGERRRRVIIVTVWFFSSLLLALNTDNIGTVIHAMGSISAANVFIYPGICLMQVTLQTDPDLKRLRSRLFVVGAILFAAMGAFFFGLILTDSLINRGAGGASESLCS